MRFDTEVRQQKIGRIFHIGESKAYDVGYEGSEQLIGLLPLEMKKTDNVVTRSPSYNQNILNNMPTHYHSKNLLHTYRLSI